VTEINNKNTCSLVIIIIIIIRLPEGFITLINLNELYLNDTFLEYLPGSFGRLSKLKILELRENRLKTLPKSLDNLIHLERLDVGTNDFELFVNNYSFYYFFNKIFTFLFYQAGSNM